MLKNAAGQDAPAVADTADGEQTTDGARIGAFATVAPGIKSKILDRLVVTGLRSQAADDWRQSSRVLREYGARVSANIHVEYVSCGLNVLQTPW